MKDTNLGERLRAKFNGKRVLVTGHTGFKGSWLSLWLRELGADVSGYSLPPPTSPSHFEMLERSNALEGCRFENGDIRDGEALKRFFKEAKPEIVFHLAAQPIVLESYADPVTTYDVNVMGTLRVFEASRRTETVRAIVNVTSDKCYENREWIWGYRENEPMGGYDPYSSSKGCSEILTSSYRRSFFPLSEFGRTHSVLLASGRAGNVIGGGDWAKDRLIPDIVRAASAGKAVHVRQPNSVRPWQHVLEPLAGYLLLGAELLAGNLQFAEGFNFGPDADGGRKVGDVTNQIAKYWPLAKFEYSDDKPGRRSALGEIEPVHEATLLQLDSSKARRLLKWTPRLSFDETIQWTAAWYRSYVESSEVLSKSQLRAYQDHF